jgi:hypothetical protein
VQHSPPDWLRAAIEVRDGQTYVDPGKVDVMRLGRIALAYSRGNRISPEDAAALDALKWHRHIIANAQMMYQLHQVQERRARQWLAIGGSVATTTMQGTERTVTVRHGRAALKTSAVMPRRPQARGPIRRPAARVSRSSARSGDSGDEPPGEPAPAILRVRRPSGIVQTFEADHLETDAGILWATGRWRRRVGLNYSQIRYSHPGTYGFGAGEIVEVRT